MSTNDKHLILKGLEEELASVAEEGEKLVRRQAALEKAVAGVRELISLNGGGQITALADKPIMARNAFTNMPIAKAAIKYLRLVKKNQKNREITEGLLQGGKKRTGKNFSNTVRSVLLYEAKKPKSLIYWSGKDWGLKEWLRSAPQEETTASS